MNGLHKELEGQGFTLLLVDMGEDRETVARVVAERGYTAPVVLDSDERVKQAYGVRGTPTVVVIGRDGTILGRALGPRPWAGPAGRALLQALLRADSAQER
jgi:peroxiredoxin